MTGDLQSLNLMEAGIVSQIRQCVHLSPTPDESIVQVVTSSGREARAAGVPFSNSAVLKVLYPEWAWGRVEVARW